MKKIFFVILALMQFLWAFEIDSVEYKNDFLSFKGSGFSEFGVSKNEIIKTKPKMSGIYEFISDKEINFYPNSIFPKGLEFECLNCENKFKFSVLNFEIMSLKAIKNGFAVVKFNDFLSLDEMKKNLFLYKNNNLSKNAIDYELSSDDNRTIFIKFDPKFNDINLKISSNLKSIHGINLLKDESVNLNDAEFIENKTALNLTKILPISKAYDDGSIGVRLYFKDYITPSAKFIKVKNISKISLTQPSWDGISINNEWWNYCVDIKSDEFKPNTNYQISLLKGFGDNRNLLRNKFDFNITLGDRKPFVKFSDSKKFIPKSAQIAFKSANLNEIDVLVSKVSDQNIRYFLNYERYGETASYTKEIINKKFTLNGAKNEIKEHKINLDFKGFEDGIYEIAISYKNDDERYTINKTAYISDITALATLSENGAFILTTRLSNGEILPRAKVQIFSDKNDLIFEGSSDSKGVLNIKQKDFLNKNPRSILIKKHKESGFVIFDEAISRIDKTTTNVRSKLYFASNLIKPNENLKGIFVMKDLNFKALKNLPISLKITDPKNIEIINKKLKTDDFGSVLIDENIGEVTGIYKAEIIFENKIVANSAFSVENFIPNRIRNEILLEKTEFFAPQKPELKLNANYLVGLPAANLKANLISNYSQKKLKFDEFSGYSFVNEKLSSNYALQTNVKNFILDQNGSKEVIVPIPDNLSASNALEVMLNFSVFDSDKTINKYQNIVFFPYKTITGIKSNKNYASTDEEINFDLLSLQSQSKKRLSNELEIEIYSNNFSYIFNGSNFIEQNEFVLIDSFKTNKSSFSYKFKNGGNYLIVANDYKNGSSASVSVDVSGWGYWGKLNPKDLKTAKITLQKSKFKPGETIKGTINSVIQDGILSISLISDEVLDYKIKQIKSNSTNFELKIPKNFTGGHISASIFRPSTQNSSPIRSYANIPVSVDNNSHEAKIAISHAPTAKTGSTQTISLKTKPNSKVALFAVDFGILDIIEQKEINAFSDFDKPLFYNLRYFDIFDEISTYTTKANALSFGGDEMVSLKAAKRDLSPVKTQKESSFILIKEGISNANGELKFDIKFPSNLNSKVRLSAIAIDDNSIGSSNSYLEIKDDIIIKPALLSYMIKGDEIDFGLSILNTTNEPKQTKIEILSSSNLQIGKFEPNLSLKPLGSTNESIKLKALDLGEANLVFKAGDYRYELEFSIISQYPSSKFQQNGFINKKTNISISDQSYKELFVNIASTPVVFDLAYDLKDYPYGCTEQIASKMVALDYSYSKDANQTTLDELNRYAKILLSRLKDNGEFGFWSAYGYTDKYTSVYTSDVLLDLDTKYKFLGDYQRNLIFSGLKNTNSNNFVRLYADFVLNQYKKLEQREMNYVYDNKIYEYNALSTLLMSAILKSNSMQSEFYTINKQINNYKQFKQISQDSEANFESEIKNMAFALYVYSYLDKNEISQNLSKEISENLLNLSNTQQKAFIIRSFDKYFKNADKTTKFALEIDGKQNEFNAQISRKFTPKNKQISIIPQDDKGVFYSVLSFGYEKTALKHKNYDPSEFDKPDPKSKKQIKIYREFVDNNGKKVNLNSLKVGNQIFAKTRVFANFWVRNLAIDEGVSSCFEVINERLYPNIRTKATIDSAKFNHKEYLDDRVFYFPSDFMREIVIFTPLSVIISGKCSLPATKAIYMQDENLNDYDLEMLNFEVSK